MLWLAVDVPSAAAVASESCSAVKSVYQAQGFRETVPSQPISGERVGGCRARDTASTRQHPQCSRAPLSPLPRCPAVNSHASQTARGSEGTQDCSNNTCHATPHLHILTDKLLARSLCVARC
ncbi:uncharacterized protein LOC135102979 isoform X1 [Scylla paramamosain]|uniref:uncharacterized protein LOC135102979 isoform X1 n=1 Tax=Scylla paramamosain TaxID=85552 RepID=UPI003082B4ED